MSNWKTLTTESKKRWERNAACWDTYMGDTSNRFYTELIEPNVMKFLNPQAGQNMLDIACGTGNFSRALAHLNVIVTAFDFSDEDIVNLEIATGVPIVYELRDGEIVGKEILAD